MFGIRKINSNYSEANASPSPTDDYVHSGRGKEEHVGLQFSVRPEDATRRDLKREEKEAAATQWMNAHLSLPKFGN